MDINIKISNNKARFGSLSIGEVFMLNETDVCIKIDYESNTWNAWNFRAKDLQTMDDNIEVTIPKEVNMEVTV